MTHRRSMPLLAMLLTLAGCATPHPGPFASAGGESLTTIRHIVLIDLVNDAEAPALISAIDANLAPIPGITHFWRGGRFDSNRPEVKGNFDVGLVIDFRDAAAYDAYTTDERHVTLVREWKPKLNSLTIYDVLPAVAKPGT